MATRKKHAHPKRGNPEYHYHQLVLLGAAFVVVMMIAIGYRQAQYGFGSVSYAPRHGDALAAMQEDSNAGACCAQGECLDLTRSECGDIGAVYWPDSDLCVTACPVTR